MSVKDDELDEHLDDYDEYDDEDDDEGGLSGLVVLLMGVVMLGAFASVVYIAYQQGLNNSTSGTPYVSADPEPLKIETADAGVSAAPAPSEVYSSLEGRESNPVETLAAGPEEPIERNSDDPIGAIAAGETGAGPAVEIVDDAVADRIAELEKQDEALTDLGAVISEAVDASESAAAEVVEAAKEPVEQLSVPAPKVAAAEPAKQAPKAAPKTVAPQPVSVVKPAASASLDPMSGSHVVQVGAFRSDAEADAFWSKMSGKVGGYLDGKAKHVQRADLGAKGVYYRVRIGPFASSDAAKTYCAGLKQRGQDCLPKAK